MLDKTQLQKFLATVKVICRTSSGNKIGLCPLRIRITLNRRTKEVSLPGARIKPADWNSSSQRVSNNRMLNVRLEQEVMKYKDVINRAITLGRQIDLDEVIAVVKGKKTLQRPAIKLSEYICENFESNMQLAYPTRKNYRSCRKRVDEFTPNIKLHEVNVEWMLDFDAWLRRKYQNKDWTMHARMKIIRRILRHASENNVIDPVDLSGYKLKTGKARKQFVTIGKLRTLIYFIPITELDHKILRAFLFSCFVGGMRFGDLCTLSYLSIHQTTSEHQPTYKLDYVMRKMGRYLNFSLNHRSIEQIDLSLAGSSGLVFELLKSTDLKLSKDGLSKAIESRNSYCNKRLKAICRDTLIRLAEGIYIEKAENIFITGSTGVGKSHIACALGHQACCNEKRVMYFNTSRLLAQLKVAKVDGSYVRALRRIQRQHLIILDDFGLQAIDATCSHILLEVVEDRYNIGSLIITSQIPVDRWYELIANKTLADAIMDRLVHKSHRIDLKGESMRKKKAKEIK